MKWCHLAKDNNSLLSFISYHHKTTLLSLLASWLYVQMILKNKLHEYHGTVWWSVWYIWSSAAERIWHDVKLAFHDTELTPTSSRGSSPTRPTRAIKVIPVASWTTRQHSCDDSREDVGEDVGIGVVECELYSGLLIFVRWRHFVW